jgi:hypothetical protein
MEAPMKSTRLVPAVIAHALFLGVAAALLCCGSSNEEHGVTNMQPESSSTNIVPLREGPNAGQPNQRSENSCLARGTSCISSDDCCSLWCVNGHCAVRQP